MATTSNKDVTAAAWTLMFTAASGALAVGLEHRNEVYSILLHVGASDPGAGDASLTGRLMMAPANPAPSVRDLTLDVGDKLWARFTGGAGGQVTVLG